jgi:putative thioredoxin
MAEASPWIIETTLPTFERDVVERSHELPVVVDFWATWCGPCQQLGPVLEKLAREYNGKFLLVKVDVDQQPEIAGAFGVQSIPHVFALKDGQAVNQFLGNLPEDQIRAWLDQLLPSPYDTLLAEAQPLEQTDPKAAEAKYREAAQLMPGESAAQIGLARVLLGEHRDSESRAVIADLESRGFLEPDAQNIKAELDLRASAEESGGVQEARRAAAADPNNLQSQLHLADALAASHQHAEALQILLDLVQKDKAGIGPAARDSMVKIFQVLGNTSDLTQTYRRKLATAMY